MCLVGFTPLGTEGGSGGVGVTGVVTSPVLVVTNVAKHGGNGHCGDQDGVGDGEYQHKDKTDDAELFGLMQFVILLFAEGLCEGEGREVCVCVPTYICLCSTHHYTHDCGWYETEESRQPTENCEDECGRHAGSKGILREFGGELCRPCECLLSGGNGHLRLSQDHLWLCCVRGGIVRV